MDKNKIKQQIAMACVTFSGINCVICIELKLQKATNYQTIKNPRWITNKIVYAIKLIVQSQLYLKNTNENIWKPK